MTTVKTLFLFLDWKSLLYLFIANSFRVSFMINYDNNGVFTLNETETDGETD